MKKDYILKNGSWKNSDFDYIYSPICKTFGEFVQEEDHIRNFAADGTFEYISMVSKASYTTGTKMHLKCSFDTYGAPLITITDDILNDDKVKRYGLHFEVVTYKDGVNVWRIIPAPEKPERPVATTKIHAESFTIEEGSLVDITVKVEEKRFVIDVNGVTFSVEDDQIPESFHMGFTACEGINRFYELSIEEGSF